VYIRGSLDVITTTGLAGWAHAPDTRDGLTVQALLNHQVIGEAVADMHRADLAAVGIGDGNCGYSITFYHPLDPLYLPFVAVKPEGGDVELPRTNIAGYGDFFQALFRQWPVTGRHRSVLGGLWTDRTDAAALLRARREIGMLAPAVADAVEPLVRSGLMLLPLQADARGAVVDAALRAMESAIAVPQVIAALRAVLEDHPLVLRPHLCDPAGPFRQPSGMEALASPAECLLLMLPLDGPVELEVVRDSHLLPEFTPDGASRWMSRTGAEGLAMAEQHGLLDRFVVAPDTLAVIGPGLLHRILAPEGGAAVALTLPARTAPLRQRVGDTREVVCENGARIWS
jgi:hypothetical protein